MYVSTATVDRWAIKQQQGTLLFKATVLVTGMHAFMSALQQFITGQ